MTAQAMEHRMESPVRAESPELGIWQNPGPGALDPEIWKSVRQTAELLMTSPQSVRKYLVGKVPHITTLARKAFFHVDLVNAIRNELLQGNDLDIALAKLGIEPPTEEEQAE